jgi:hypothetical protein
MIGTFVEVCLTHRGADLWCFGRIVSVASNDQVLVEMRSRTDMALPEKVVISMFGCDKVWRVMEDQRPSANMVATHEPND